jgi:hypothetical protein
MGLNPDSKLVHKGQKEQVGPEQAVPGLLAGQSWQVYGKFKPVYDRFVPILCPFARAHPISEGRKQHAGPPAF